MNTQLAINKKGSSTELPFFYEGIFKNIVSNFKNIILVFLRNS